MYVFISVRSRNRKEQAFDVVLLGNHFGGQFDRLETLLIIRQGMYIQTNIYFTVVNVPAGPSVIYRWV